MLRFFTAGESHGKGVVVIIEGLPANLPISTDKIRETMRKRKIGVGSGGRQLVEDDAVDIISGVRFGKTIGSPIALQIVNKDFSNWGEKMSSEPIDEKIIEKLKVVKPRPGHADLVGIQKYNLDDVRNVLERASARETTGRVAAGALFLQFLEYFDIQVASHTLQIGNIINTKPYIFSDIKNVYTTSPETRCIDTDTSDAMKILVQRARTDMNTLGGVVETWAINVPPGLGSHVHWDRKIDGQLAQALMSIQSVKAIEIGTGFNNASQYGTEVHDEIFYSQEESYYRKTNRAGGIEGGITNGMPVIVRAYHKPISTIYKPLHTVNIKTHADEQATVERSDICIVPRGGIVSEAMLAYVLTQNFIEKFGNDDILDITNTYQSYLKRIR
ncbi:MAG: chorismate synthase [Candidatus Roizmanbacteria bacterium]